jgi:hypothetical protein
MSTSTQVMELFNFMNGCATIRALHPGTGAPLADGASTIPASPPKPHK